MKDDDKTKEELLHELSALRQRVRELESAKTELETTTQSLSAKLEVMQLTVDALPVLVSYVDSDQRYQFCNKTYQQWFRVGFEEIVGRRMKDRLPESLYDKIRPYIEGALSGERVEFEVTVEHGDGIARDVNVLYVPHFSERGEVKGFAGLRTDVTERNVAARRLKEANELSQAIIRSAPVGITVFRSDGQCVMANEAIGSIIGGTREQILAQNFRHLESWRRSGLLDLAEEVLMRGEELRRKIHITTRFGKEVWLDCRLNRFSSGGEPHLLVVADDNTIQMAAEEAIRNTMDGLEKRVAERTAELASVNEQLRREIAERLRSEDALQKSEALYRGLYEGSADGIILSDDNGVIVDVNRRFSEIYGYEPDTVRGTKVVDLVHPDDLKRVPFRYQSVLSGESVRIERRVRKQDGNYLFVDIHAKLVAENLVQAVHRDVTRLKLAEEAERLLVTAVEQSVESILVTDRDGNIKYVNPAFVRISGYSRDEVIGKKPRLLKSEAHDKPFYEKMLAAIKKGEAWKGRITSRRKDGTLYHEDVTISPVRDATGQIVNYVDLGHDVTQQVGLEQQLFQAQKMEAIGTLAGGLAHDFNNLLTVIFGFAQMLLMDRRQGDPDYDDLRRIAQAAQNGADLVKRILTFSRKAETRVQPVDLNHEVHRAGKLLDRTFPKMITSRQLLEDGLKRINADPGQIEQVLLNLAVNARDAMPEGGKIIIETRNVTLDDEYCSTHMEAKPGPHILLRVSDTGHGMGRDVLDHVFEPFFTTKEPGKGTGLGLAMVYGIVKGHGGHIMCYSEPGLGTTFSMYFPAIDGPEKPDATVAAVTSGSGTETILLVDDEEPVRDLAKRLLSRAGYHVLTAADGKEAIETFCNQRDEIALVILDLIMPEMSGRQCLAGLLGIDPKAKVVISSGYSADPETGSTVGRLTKGFIAKPYDLKQLLRVVRDALDSA